MTETKLDPRRMRWQWFEDSCPSCGDSAKVLTDSGKDNFAYDGDLVMCYSCGHRGGVSCDGEGGAHVDWHGPEPACDCPGCKEFRDNKKKHDELTRLRAIVDQLPATADGVPMVPGMKVFHKGDSEEELTVKLIGHSMWHPDDQRHSWVEVTEWGEMTAVHLHSTSESAGDALMKDVRARLNEGRL